MHDGMMQGVVGPVWIAAAPRQFFHASYLFHASYQCMSI